MKKKLLKKKVASDKKKVYLYSSVSNENCDCCNRVHNC
jgi:hypothetical protein